MSKQFLLFVFLCCGLVIDTFAQIKLSTATPEEGQTVKINLEQPDSMVIITYRPNSAVTTRDTLKATPLASSFEWTPQSAGIANLSTTNQGSLNVSIRFRGLSVSGIAVMIIAGGLLFGGAAFAFRLLFKDEEEDGTLDMDLDHMPDT